jgi:hypothetical protein
MLTFCPSHFSADELREAMAAAPPGETIVYYEGNLAADLRLAQINKDSSAAELRLVARMALEASERGEAHLTQRRVAAETCQYRLTKAHPESRSPLRESAKRVAREAA